MSLFIKAFIIGIGKIIPGVSGALLAINFGIYEDLIKALTTFSNNYLKNLKFLAIVLSGIFLAIILGSKIILYTFNNYQFITLLFFQGLIIGGIYNFTKKVKLNRKNIIIILSIIIIFITLNILNHNNYYTLKNNLIDNFIFFLGGIIEIFASIIPGISSTALLIMLGIYEHILTLIANIYNFNYVIINLNLYLSYGIGMLISLIFNLYIISIIMKKYPETFNAIILGLAISSSLFLILITIKLTFTIKELLIGIYLFFLGLVIAKILDK